MKNGMARIIGAGRMALAYPDFAKDILTEGKLDADKLGLGSGFEGTVEECNGVLGTRWTMDDVGRIGKEVLDLERDFNRKAGFTAQDDRLPEFMKSEPLPPHNTVWDIADRELDRVFAS